MKFDDSVALYEYVKEHKEKFTGPDRGTVKEMAAQIAREVGFKVNSDNLARAMRRNGIESRRPSRNGAVVHALEEENQRLTKHCNELRRTLAKVLAHKILPPELHDLICGDLSAEILRQIMSE